MDLKLNIYDKKEITKTYTAETYDLMFGTVEDLLDVIDIDNIQAGNKAELLKAIAKVLASSMNIVKPLLKEVFDGLTDEELSNIIKYTRQILSEAIKKGGSTIRSYTSVNGVHGLFQQELLVHTKENTPCKNCGTTILKIKVNGRGTYYCPNCQK